MIRSLKTDEEEASSRNVDVVAVVLEPFGCSLAKGISVAADSGDDLKDVSVSVVLFQRLFVNSFL